MDTGRRAELLAARLSVPQICEHIGADSLGYLSVRGLLQAMGRHKDTSCLACFDGAYPVPVQMEMGDGSGG
jgi:amidophosphoribosyltransferase